MKKALMALVLGIVLFGFSGCNGAKEPPIEVRSGIRFNTFNGKEIVTLNIASLADSVTIKRILVNRGNCKLYSFGMKREDISNYKELNFNVSLSEIDPKKIQFNKTLEYGKEWVIDLKCDRVLEAQIATDKGEWTFKF